MGMVVRTNTMAQNAFRQLGLNNNAVAKSLQKLSSGFRINSAADDAAGLAISEKMKAQITGLETAATNAQDGISLIQTAEGALDAVHNMLNRMVELATKSANGTYSINEREALQAEVDSLLEEIDRVAQSTNFNGINLLDGSLGFNAEAFSINNVDAVKPRPAEIDKTNADGKAFPMWTEASKDSAEIHLTRDGSQTAPYFEIDLADIELTNSTAADISTAFKITLTDEKGNTVDLSLDDANAIKIGATVTAGQLASALQKANTEVKFGYASYTVGTDGNKLTFTFKDSLKTVATDAEVDQAGVVTSNMYSPSASVGITLGGLVKKNDLFHDTINVKNPIAPQTGGRAGIDFDFSKDTSVFADGNRLTIDGTTFVFKTSKESSAAAGKGEILIDVSDTAKDGQLAEAIDMMSHFETANFEVEVKNGTTIHIDQKVNNKNIYDTRDSLVNLFTLEKGGAAAGTAITLSQDKLQEGNTISIGGHAYRFGKDVSIGATAEDTLNNLKAALYRDGFTSQVSGSTITVFSNDADAKIGPSSIGGGLALQIGDTGADYNMMMVSVADMGTKALLLDGLDITTADGARAALDSVKNAINLVSENRAAMGAMQNRLEYTINNLDTAVENMSSANSRIRDTDMAKEMMNYTQMNILTQAAQAMLAQANQQPQAILQLLQ